ncbi:MAG TPA: hypothetical protein VMS98_08455 [Thermoanaerobaculia bacterium]|nr:hypothetical protein [Thermoanaerobaculia bacterium]
MTSAKPAAGKTEVKKQGGGAKPIRLDDLIPARNVTGGRRAVFGSVTSIPKKKK